MSTTTTTATTTSSSTPQPKRPRPTVGRVLAWVAMILIMAVTLLPFYWVLRTALSSNAGLASDPTSILPVDTNLRGFARVFGLQGSEEAIADGGSGEIGRAHV